MPNRNEYLEEYSKLAKMFNKPDQSEQIKQKIDEAMSALQENKPTADKETYSNLMETLFQFSFLVVKLVGNYFMMFMNVMRS